MGSSQGGGRLGGSRTRISNSASKGAMADRRHEEEDHVIAFKSGNKLVAEQLLPRIPQPAAITTTFKFSSLSSSLLSYQWRRKQKTIEGAKLRA